MDLLLIGGYFDAAEMGKNLSKESNRHAAKKLQKKRRKSE
jgi:hypothetical protein